ncbi:MAG: methyl-accepting chemotaxis protein [Promethearchaeota archaeon]
MAKKKKMSYDVSEGLPLPLIVIDKDFNIENANPALLTTLGLKKEDLIGKKCYDIFKQDMCETANCIVQKAWRKNGVTDPEEILAINAKTKENMDLRVTGAPLVDKSGNLIGGIETFEDITEDKANQEYSDGLRIGLPIGLMGVDKDFIIQNVNPEFEKMLGLDEKDVLGRNCGDIFKLDICGTKDCLVQRAWDTDVNSAPIDIQTQNAKTNANIDIRVIGSPLKNKRGRILGGVETFQDVTEEKANQEYAEGLRIGLPIGLMGVDKDFIIRSVNPEFERMLGLDMKDVLGRKCADIFKLDICGTKDCLVQRAWDTDVNTAPIDIQTQNAKTNANIDIRVIGSPMKNKRGDILGGVETFQDVTEEKANQEYADGLRINLPIGLMGVDKDFIIQNVNPEFERMLGLDEKDMLGRNCGDIFKLDICGTKDCLVQRAWDTDANTDPIDIPTKNAKTNVNIELRVVGASNKNDRGDILGGVGTFQDVTMENKTAREVEIAAEQISSSVEELSSSAEEVSSASENIASTQQQLSKGSADQVMQITETQQKMGDLSKGIRNVREKVINIGQISDLIKGIASQTNMLALNAAIEAARAGEAGRGFNVVADQVRKLADESSKAVANTEEMLGEIDKISEQQESGAVDILDAIDKIATIAEESSSSTEEAASAAEEQASSMESITTTAQNLMSIVEKLEANIEEQKLAKEGKNKKSDNTDRNKRKMGNSGKNEQKRLEKEIIVDKGNSDSESAF